MFNIFRVYEQNHPENLVIKPETRQSAPEIDFTPRTQLTFEAPKLSHVPSVAPLLEQESVTADAQEAIFRITDINEMIAAGRFAAAEYLLGRKLTMDEVRDKMVRDLMKAPEKEVDQIRKEILRDQLKAKMAAQMTAAAAKAADDIKAANQAGPRQLGPPGPPGPPPPGSAPRPGQAPQSQPPGNVPLRHVPPPPPPISQLPKLPPSPPSSPKGSVQPSGADYVADFIDFMGTKKVPGVEAQQMLRLKTGDLLAALASSPAAGDAQLKEEMSMKQALARYESLLRGEKVAEDEVTDKLNELATRLNATIPLAKAVAMDSADLNTELLDMGLDPAKVSEIVAAQAEVQNKLGFGVVLMSPSPSPPPAGGPKLITRDDLKKLPMKTDAEKQTTAEALWKSYQMTLDPKIKLDPQEIYEGRQTFKVWMADVRKEAMALVAGNKKEEKKTRIDFKKTYAVLPNLKDSPSLNVTDIRRIIAAYDDEAAAKRDEIQKYPGVKTTGSGIVNPGVVNRKTRAQWIPFGPKYVLNYDKFRQGLFSLAYPKTGQPPLWTGQVTLTRPLRVVLEAFLNNEPASQDDLDKQEKTWVNHVFRKAGIIKDPPNLLPKQRQIRSQRDMAERMKVLLGEQSAGNDSPLILKELGTLGQKMASRGYITQDQWSKIEQLIALG